MLVTSALYWLNRFYVKALRVDAVASMLYLDYPRRLSEWLPDSDSSNDNRNAVRFLDRYNELVYGEPPGAITVAEESTASGGVPAPTRAGRLGFKWNMG